MRGSSNFGGTQRRKLHFFADFLNDVCLEKMDLKTKVYLNFTLWP